MDKNDTTWIRIVYDRLDEQLDENSQLRDLVIECEELRPECEEIAAFCELVDQITNPSPGTYTASY